MPYTLILKLIQSFYFRSKFLEFSDSSLYIMILLLERSKVLINKSRSKIKKVD